MVMVKIDEEVFELKEIRWRTDATYLLMAKEAKDEIGIEAMMMQMRNFLKSIEFEGISFLVIPKETALLFEDKKRELIRQAFAKGFLSSTKLMNGEPIQGDGGSRENPEQTQKAIEESLQKAVEELCGDDRGLDPILPLTRKPNPNIVPPTYDVVTEGYDPSKINKKGDK